MPRALGLGIGTAYGPFSSGGGAPTPTNQFLIVSGQSNSMAPGVSSIPPAVAAIDSARVKIWNGSAFVGYVAGTNSEPTGVYPTKWGPEAQFAIEWLAAHATGTLYIVKRGVDGTAISTWQPGQTNFDNQTTWVVAARAALSAVTYTDAGVIWCQGESDAIVSQSLADAYQAKLLTTIAGMRSAWGSGSLKVAIMRIYDANMTYRSTVRAAQNAVAYADPLAYLFNTDDQTLVDTYHYNNAGVLALGSRAYASLTTGATIESNPPSVAKLAISNGVRTWYNQPMTIVDGTRAYVGSISSIGNVQISKIDAGITTTFTLAAALEVDDHDDASPLKLPSGKLFCAYSKHSTETTGVRYRVSTNALPDISAFGTEQQIANGGVATSYAQPFLLSDGNVYVFYRSGASGTFPRKVAVATPANIEAGTPGWSLTTYVQTTNQRPYVIIKQAAPDKLLFIATNGHPNETVTSVYCFYMQIVGGVPKYYNLAGTELTLPIDPTAGLATLIDDATGGRTWNWDVAVGLDGHPRVLWTKYPSSTGARSVLFSDIEYWHGRWNGSAWVKTRLSTGNASIYAVENHYAGGMCFDGNDVTTLYLSESSSGQYELNEYSFNEGAQTKTLTRAITSGSSSRQWRPVSPSGVNRPHSVNWLSGSYTSYLSYNTDVWAFGPAILTTLTLSSPIFAGAASSGTIIGATPGSTITSNVAGLTVNSGARTYTWDGTGAAGTTANGLVETGPAGAVGDPKNSAIIVQPANAYAFRDTFDEATTVSITAHTPNVGSGGYVLASGNTMEVVGGAGYARGNVAGTALAVNQTPLPADNEYIVGANISRDATTGFVGIFLAYTDTNNYVQLYYEDSSSRFILVENLTGSNEKAAVSDAFPLNTTRNIEVRTNKTTKVTTAYLDGVQIGSPFNTLQGNSTGKFGARSRAGGRIHDLYIRV